MELDEIRNQVISNNITFSRSRKIEDMYTSMRESTLKIFATMEDFINVEIFGMRALKNLDGKYYVADITIEPKYVLTLNTYPYDVAKDVLHYVLWSTVPLMEKTICNILDKEFQQYEDMFWFEQAKESKSIKNVWHVHVFVK